MKVGSPRFLRRNHAAIRGEHGRPRRLILCLLPEILGIAKIFSQSNLVSSVRRLRPALRDPDDDRILEMAVSCGALIVTHNLRDFEAASWRHVEAVSPVELLRRLRGPV